MNRIIWIAVIVAVIFAIINRIRQKKKKILTNVIISWRIAFDNVFLPALYKLKGEVPEW